MRYSGNDMGISSQAAFNELGREAPPGKAVAMLKESMEDLKIRQSKPKTKPACGTCRQTAEPLGVTRETHTMT